MSDDTFWALFTPRTALICVLGSCAFGAWRLWVYAQRFMSDAAGDDE